MPVTSPLNQFDAARLGAPGIKAYAADGGKFTDKCTETGYTAAIFAAWKGADAIYAFHEAGGRFTNHQTKTGWHVGWETLYTAAMFAAHDAASIRAFAKCGGEFNDIQDATGSTAAMCAVRANPEAIRALSDVGGIFTDIKAKDGSDIFSIARQKGPETVKALDEAIARQDARGIAMSKRVAPVTARPVRALQPLRLSL